MSVQAARRAFVKANKRRGLSDDELEKFHATASAYAQEALDFILPFLGRNSADKVLSVMQSARSAFDGRDMCDGVREVLAQAQVGGFPDTSITGTTWVLDACIYAAENYEDPSTLPAEESVPVLK